MTMNQSNMAVVVTSINAPNATLRALADGCLEHGADFIVAGDTRSPAGFSLEGCRFFSIRAPLDSDLRFPRACPVRHYARKNIGYLEAIRAGAELIVETDDDNLPEPEFFGRRPRVVTGRCVDGCGLDNVYRYFTHALVWPRGFLLDRVTAPVPPPESLRVASRDCPIQQGLANENPDVDAVYRLIMPLPLSFNSAPPVALGPGSWCPFNTQNTSWWPDAYPLLYLPAYCSFRMTDIWRSFVAQRIAWAQGWSILFHGPTVRQHRKRARLHARLRGRGARISQQREDCGGPRTSAHRVGRGVDSGQHATVLRSAGDVGARAEDGNGAARLLADRSRYA